MTKYILGMHKSTNADKYRFDFSEYLISIGYTNHKYITIDDVKSGGIDKFFVIYTWFIDRKDFSTVKKIVNMENSISKYSSIWIMLLANFDEVMLNKFFIDVSILVTRMDALFLIHLAIVNNYTELIAIPFYMHFEIECDGEHKIVKYPHIGNHDKVISAFFCYAHRIAWFTSNARKMQLANTTFKHYDMETTARVGNCHTICEKLIRLCEIQPLKLREIKHLCESTFRSLTDVGIEEDICMPHELIDYGVTDDIVKYLKS